MSALDEILLGRSAIVCVGPGGVGKTTTAAALALRAARMGRKVLVLTVDPARRLANSLGMESMLPEETRVSPEALARAGLACDGELWAMMLDTKRTFDRTIERHAPSEDARSKIMDNPFYDQLSSALAGSQEYMAMEKMYELRDAADFDLVVLDTPPTHQALDFLDAPNRMEDFFDSSALKALIRSGKAMGRIGAGLFKVNALILKGVGRFIGADVFLQILGFLEALTSMSTGFAARARHVKEMLRQDDVAFLVVTTPDPLALEEGRYFHDRLTQEGMPFGAFVVNRMRKPFFADAAPGSELVQVLADRLWESPTVRMRARSDVQRVARRLVSAAQDYTALSIADRRRVDELIARLPTPDLVYEVFHFQRDIHDLAALHAFEQILFRDVAA
jgi:anion-transporting  ArsA/GET3 family ATPase